MSGRSCAASCGMKRRQRPLEQTARTSPFMTDARDVAPEEVLAFWREAGPARWYKKDAGFDAVVRSRFLGLWQKAAAGELTSWETSDDGTLALVILLDQFPRNMFRDDVRTYSSD